MDFTLTEGDYAEHVLPLISDMRRMGVTYDNPQGTVWYVAKSNFGEVAGVCAAIATKNTVRFKSVYVKSYFRKKGIYAEFLDMVDEYAISKGIYRVTGFFNERSVYGAIKHGYVVSSVNKNNVAFAEKILEQERSSL